MSENVRRAAEAVHLPKGREMSRNISSWLLSFHRRVDESGANLEEAKYLMQNIGGVDGPGLAEEVCPGKAMIDGLLVAMHQASLKVPELFGALGHRFDLMVSKGDLVLAGAHFSEEHYPNAIA